MRYQGKRNQKGIALIGWALAASIVLMTMNVVIRLLPVYFESKAVQKSIESVASEPTIKSMSVFQVKELLSKRFYMNDVKRVKPDNVLLAKKDKALEVQLKYEIRVHIISNIDAVLNFNPIVVVD